MAGSDLQGRAVHRQFAWGNRFKEDWFNSLQVEFACLDRISARKGWIWASQNKGTALQSGGKPRLINPAAIMTGPARVPPLASQRDALYVAGLDERTHQRR